MTRALRLLAIGMILFASLCGAEAAQASSCSTVTGSRTVTLSQCPLSATVRYKEPGFVPLNATFGGNLLSVVYVEISSTNNDFNGHVSGELVLNQARMDLSPMASLSVGVHTGFLNFKFCADQRCATVLAQVQMPFKLDVITVPAIAKLSPASGTVGDGPFTLKVLGSFFKPGYKIRLNGSALATTYVSSTELTARMDLASVPTGRDYNLQVISLTPGFNSNTESFTLKNPKPVLTSISTTALLVGAAPFTLTVKGSGFIRTSKIQMDGTGLTTKFVSSTQLTASLDFSTAAAGTHSFTVVTDTPGGGTSTKATLSITNATPVITSISPTSKPAGGVIPVTLTINGSGFQQNSQVVFSGAVNQTPVGGFVSPTQMDVQIPTLTPAGDITVTVVTPAPGGGTSNSETLEIDNPAPTLDWISPIGAYANGGSDVVVTAKGSNFATSTVVEWNGVALTTLRTAFGVNDFIQATLPKANLASATTATVSVFTPGPGGGTSSKSFTVSVHPPEIDSLSPGSAAPGGGDFTLTLDGQDFDQAAAVYWNGDQLTISNISSTQIQVTVPAAEIADAGVVRLTVVNPVATGGTSVPVSFAVDASGTSVVALAQAVNDIEWDPANFAFYGSSHAADVNYPHAIITVDPVLGAVSSSADVTDEADLLSLAKDDEFLYASFTGKIERLALPGFSLVASTGANTTSVLQVSPVYAQVVAASEKFGSAAAVGFVWDPAGKSYAINGDGWDALAWSPDGATLYGGDDESGKGNFMAGSYDLLSLSRPVIIPSYAGLWSGGAMHVDAASGLVYADQSANVINPTSGTNVGSFPVSGVMTPDSSLGCAYFITQTAAQVTAAAGDWTLSCYSTSDQTLTRSIVIPSVTGTPTKMMRWGNEGLVFMTDGGMIYFVSGQVVTGN